MGDQPQAVCSKGFLSQVLAEHLRIGGRNPKVMHHSQMLAAGMDIRRAPAQTEEGAKRECGAFVLFRNSRESERKLAGIKYNKAQNKASCARLVAEWNAMSLAEREVWKQKSRSDYLESQNKEAEPDPQSVRDLGVYSTFVQEFGNADVPFEPENFDLVVKKSMGIDHADVLPGFRRYAAALRTLQEPYLFQEDKGPQPSLIESVFILYMVYVDVSRPTASASLRKSLGLHACGRRAASHADMRPATRHGVKCGQPPVTRDAGPATSLVWHAARHQSRRDMRLATNHGSTCGRPAATRDMHSRPFPYHPRPHILDSSGPKCQ